MIRELRHLVAVAFGRVPLIWPLVCGHCGRSKQSLSRADWRFYQRNSFARCWRDMHPMRPVHVEPDLSHIKRAAAYYGDGEQP